MMEGETRDGAGKGEEDGNIRLFRLDPFVQPRILKALFEQLPVEQLAKCRLVSKLWYNESLSIWRAKATLKFVKEGLVSTLDDGSRRKTSVGEFLVLWDTGEWDLCPFKKFHLDSWNVEITNLDQELLLDWVGAHVTSLTFENCFFFERTNFRRIIYQAFPKLQVLKMDHCYFDDWSKPTEENEKILAYKKPAFGVHELKSLEISNCRPHSMMMDMLSHFHKVKNLHLDGRGPEYRKLLEIIRLIRAQDHTKLPLNNFDVEFVLEMGKSAVSSIDLLKLLDQLHLPVQRLQIVFSRDMRSDLFNEDVIRDILQHHSSTLKCLTFAGADRHGLCKLFPSGLYLDKLEKLVSLPSHLPRNLNYLLYMPNLRVLEIWNDSLKMSESDKLFSNSSRLTDKNKIGDWTLPSLTDLKLNFPVSDCNLGKLMKWVPSVERLSMVSLDDLKLSMVCENWKNLKRLKGSREDTLTDKGVLGIKNPSEAGSCPNITKLKHLTSFWTRSSKLTSASVHEGFLKLANLKELVLGHSTQIDAEAKAALRRRKIKYSVM